MNKGYNDTTSMWHTHTNGNPSASIPDAYISGHFERDSYIGAQTRDGQTLINKLDTHTLVEKTNHTGIIDRSSLRVEANISSEKLSNGNSLVNIQTSQGNIAIAPVSNYGYLVGTPEFFETNKSVLERQELAAGNDTILHEERPNVEPIGQPENTSGGNSLLNRNGPSFPEMEESYVSERISDAFDDFAGRGPAETAGKLGGAASGKTAGKYAGATAGAYIGGVIAGPVGAIIGYLVGVKVGKFAGGYIGGKIGGYVGREIDQTGGGKSVAGVSPDRQIGRALDNPDKACCDDDGKSFTDRNMDGKPDNDDRFDVSDDHVGHPNESGTSNDGGNSSSSGGGGSNNGGGRGESDGVDSGDSGDPDGPAGER